MQRRLRRRRCKAQKVFFYGVESFSENRRETFLSVRIVSCRMSIEQLPSSEFPRPLRGADLRLGGEIILGIFLSTFIGWSGTSDLIWRLGGLLYRACSAWFARHRCSGATRPPLWHPLLLMPLEQHCAPATRLLASTIWQEVLLPNRLQLLQRLQLDG